MLLLLRLRGGGDNVVVRPEVVSVEFWLDLWQLRYSLHFYCHLAASKVLVTCKHSCINVLTFLCAGSAALLVWELLTLRGPERDCSHALDCTDSAWHRGAGDVTSTSLQSLHSALSLDTPDHWTQAAGGGAEHWALFSFCNTSSLTVCWCDSFDKIQMLQKAFFLIISSCVPLSLSFIGCHVNVSPVL